MTLLRPSAIVFALAAAFALSSVVGCSSDPDLEQLADAPGTDNSTTDPSNPTAQCSSNRTYKGFDGTNLASNRVAAEAGANRARVKPYGILLGDFKRVFGGLSADSVTTFQSAADSFDVPRPRYFVEPKATGVGMTAYLEVSFSLSEYYVKSNPTKFAALPTVDTAGAVCAELTNLAWQRRASQEELAACTDFATKMTGEKNPQRVWTYVAASILSSADFLSY